jgi:hypothetical protein
MLQWSVIHHCHNAQSFFNVKGAQPFLDATVLKHFPLLHSTIPHCYSARGRSVTHIYILFITLGGAPMDPSPRSGNQPTDRARCARTHVEGSPPEPIDSMCPEPTCPRLSQPTSHTPVPCDSVIFWFAQSFC